MKKGWGRNGFNNPHFSITCVMLHFNIQMNFYCFINGVVLPCLKRYQSSHHLTTKTLKAKIERDLGFNWCLYQVCIQFYDLESRINTDCCLWKEMRKDSSTECIIQLNIWKANTTHTIHNKKPVYNQHS